MMRAGIDIGGTFTDGVVLDRSTGSVRHAKTPSTPGQPIEGLTNLLHKLDLDPSDADLLVHGTTLVTNLILQRSGSRVGLITTLGFRDVLEIQRSYRREPLDVLWKKPSPLVPRDLRYEIDERTLADGTVQKRPDPEDVVGVARELQSKGVEALAICFFNSYRNPSNEELAREWIEETLQDLPVSISSAVDPQVREYERVSTTTVNAYAIPEVRSYLGELADTLQRDVLLMHSGGGVVPAKAVAERPVRLVQSGPAGGVIAAQAVGKRLGLSNLITFDMGGTSTDVSVIVEGRAERAEETEITWGIPMRAESLEIRSIGAGGGSIAYRDEGETLKVGPRSAGARPGPVCYGLGGDSATVTDANLVLGLVNPDRFLGGEMAIDVTSAYEVMERLAGEFGVSTEELATGIHVMVNANMAQLIRELTVNKGRDPREFTLVSFGGAGGQHAYAVADLVGCNQVVFPKHAGAFSALGLVEADLQTSEAQSVLLDLADLSLATLDRDYKELERRARANFGSSDAESEVERTAMMRYVGQTHEVMVDMRTDEKSDSLYDRFQNIHENLYGTRLDDPAEIVSLHLTVTLKERELAAIDPDQETGGTSPRPRGHRSTALFGAAVPVYDGDRFVGGEQLEGPALVEEGDTVIVVPPGSTLVHRDQAQAYVLELPSTSD